MKRRQESWKGRLEEMSIEKTTNIDFVGEMEGKRPRGAPRLRWIDNLNNLTMPIFQCYPTVYTILKLF